MKRRSFLSLIGLNMVLTACGKGVSSQGSTLGFSALQDNVSNEDMDLLVTSGQITVDSLQFIREEEKLARDVYITLFKKWGLPIFDNIAASEQVHTDRIKYLLDKHSIDDPAATTSIGEFKNQTIQKYYYDLVKRGNISELEALYVGCYIEKLDIRDLRHEISLSKSKDVIQVYTNLMNGSYNHLKAFVGQIEKRGVVYKAQLLDQEDVDQIISQGSGNTGGGQGGSSGKGGRR